MAQEWSNCILVAAGALTTMPVFGLLAPRWVDKMIGLAKDGSLHARRQVCGQGACICNGNLVDVSCEARLVGNVARCGSWSGQTLEVTQLEQVPAANTAGRPAGGVGWNNTLSSHAPSWPQALAFVYDGELVKNLFEQVGYRAALPETRCGSASFDPYVPSPLTLLNVHRVLCAGAWALWRARRRLLPRQGRADAAPR